MTFDVHFKTIPPRFLHLEKTILSWLYQTVPVRNIIITVCKEYKNFPDSDVSILNRYKVLSPKIIIQVVENDYGPSDKVVGSLKIENHTFTIICDDDIYYHEDTVLSYKEMIGKDDEIYTHYYDSNRAGHLQGADTYLLTPYFFEKVTLDEYTSFLEKCFIECSDTFFQDDYLISYFLKKKGFIVKPVTNRLAYTLVHLINELHRHPDVHRREQNTIYYLKNL
jgi:hypothetical protein